MHPPFHPIYPLPYQIQITNIIPPSPIKAVNAAETVAKTVVVASPLASPNNKGKQQGTTIATETISPLLISTSTLPEKSNAEKTASPSFL